MEPPRRPATHPTAGGTLRDGGRWRRSVQPLTWRRGLVLILMFAAIVVVTKSCQQSQVRLTKEQAIATAQREIDFRPQRTQVRLVRQGLRSRPFWAISFSVSAAKGGGYTRLTTVRVDANTGKVAAVNRQRGSQPANTP